MRTYHQLTSEQRYQIWVLKKIGHTSTEIAKALEVHKSTISRELSRNKGKRGYRPKQANEKAQARRAQTTPGKRLLAATWEVVEEKVRQDWSPEQVAGWLKQQAIRISPEWIYQHILADQRTGGDLHTHLRQHGKRRKRYGKYDRRGKLPNRVSIEERPQIVERCERLGDWEVDTLIGKGHRGALVSLVERKSRYTLLHTARDPSFCRFGGQHHDFIVTAFHKFGPHAYRRQRQRICRTHPHGRNTQGRFLFCSSLFRLGARHQRKHEWFGASLFSKED